MLITLKKIVSIFERMSKLGITHTYKRAKVIAVLRCDNCGNIFERLKSKMSPKRLNNNYFHVCNDCNAKKFAQKKGAERRTIWNRPASSADDISKI